MLTYRRYAYISARAGAWTSNLSTSLGGYEKRWGPTLRGLIAPVLVYPNYTYVHTDINRLFLLGF